jgi:hypothetical protein
MDNDGNLISARTHNSEAIVFNSPTDLLKIRDGRGITTHNHPTGRLGETSFSEGDFKHFLHWRPTEMRVVTPNYTFRLRGPEGGWGDRPKLKWGDDKKIAADVQQMRDVVALKAKAWKAAGVSEREMDFKKTHEIARLVAKAYKLRYDVEPRKK